MKIEKLRLEHVVDLVRVYKSGAKRVEFGGLAKVGRFSTKRALRSVLIENNSTLFFEFYTVLSDTDQVLGLFFIERVVNKNTNTPARFKSHAFLCGWLDGSLVSIDQLNLLSADSVVSGLLDSYCQVISQPSLATLHLLIPVIGGSADSLQAMKNAALTSGFRVSHKMSWFKGMSYQLFKTL